MRPLNKTANNPASIPEPGNFSDNAELFSYALRELTNDNCQAALARISALRCHILKTQELKSIIHLLPFIEKILLLHGVIRDE